MLFIITVQALQYHFDQIYATKIKRILNVHFNVLVVGIYQSQEIMKYPRIASQSLLWMPAQGYLCFVNTHRDNLWFTL